MRQRTNEEWLHELRSDGAVQAEALSDLRAYLLKLALFYRLRRSAGLREVAPDEIDALAEDSAQEAAFSVLEWLDPFRREAKFLTWASRFSVGRAITSLRRRQWRDASIDRVRDGSDLPAFAVVSSDGRAHPDLAACRQVVWDAYSLLFVPQFPNRGTAFRQVRCGKRQICNEHYAISTPSLLDTTVLSAV